MELNEGNVRAAIDIARVAFPDDIAHKALQRVLDELELL